LMLFTCFALASERSDEATIAQNPMADIMKLEIENRFDFGYGHKDGIKFIQTYRPSMVAGFSKHWNIINRIDLPFIYQPGTVPGEKDSFGLGDTTYESFIGSSKARTIFLGFGPAFQIPTATDNQIGTRKWSTGLSANGTLVKGPMVAGLRANHLWSVAGDDNRPDVNMTTIEYYLYANLGHGWWIGTSPACTANWEADSGEQWILPLGGGIGKIIKPNRVPINLKLEAYTYSEAPANQADWSLMLSFEFLFDESSLFKK
ncbi:MAG: hypothetical protein OES84_04865, partial [Kiritimatiellaceae bacterium]|nr:hypothetical protein [Kiritimatiellaceae bacterium]